MQLTLINGIKKNRTNYFNIYFRLFTKSVNDAENKEIVDVPVSIKKKIVYWGVKMVNSARGEASTYAELMAAFNIMECIKLIMKHLTPSDFEGIFPITKEFDGDRFGIKDYFYTKKYMRGIGEDSPIEDIDHFLWEYHNREITEFNVNLLSILSDIRRSQGHKGLMEEFCEEKGITTYTMFEGEKGKKYLRNNETGEVMEVKKPIPRYLKLVKEKTVSS